VESVYLVAIRDSGRRQEAQDVSLVITGKYDNIPFVRKRVDESSVTIVRYHGTDIRTAAAHGFGTMIIRQQSISEVWPYVLKRLAIHNCHNGNQIERSVHAPDLPTRAKFDHP
jgi:hypothetical protein